MTGIDEGGWPVPPSPAPYGASTQADPTAVMGRRILAWFLDLLLFSGLVIGLYAAQAEYVDVPSGIDDACAVLTDTGGSDVASCIVVGDRAWVLSDADVGTQTLASLAYLVFFIVLQGATGGSPGKLVTGVRVVDANGRQAGIAKSLGRTLLWAVDAAPWIVPLVGPIVALTTTGHRRVGDMAAGTYVVARTSMGQPVTPGAPAAPPPGQSPWGAPAWPGQPPGERLPPSHWDQPTAPPVRAAEPELDIPSLDVPSPTARVDESPPELGADPDWWRGPESELTEPVAPGPEAMPEPPTWDPPATPGVADPMDDWAPPTSPLDEDEAPPPPVEPGPPDPGIPAADATGAAAREPVDEEPGSPSGPAPFAPPGGEPRPVDPGAASPWEATGRDGGPRYELPPPQWDPARDTYIQWDPNQQAWLQWDTAREQWKPIDT